MYSLHTKEQHLVSAPPQQQEAVRERGQNFHYLQDFFHYLKLIVLPSFILNVKCLSVSVVIN